MICFLCVLLVLQPSSFEPGAYYSLEFLSTSMLFMLTYLFTSVFMDARSASVHVIFCRCFFYRFFVFFYGCLSWPNG